MTRNRAHVGNVFQCFDAFENKIGNLPFRILGVDPRPANPLWGETWRVLLEKALAFDSVGIARQHHRTVFQIGQHPLRDTLVVVDQIALGIAFGGPEDFVGVRDLNTMLIMHRGGRSLSDPLRLFPPLLVRGEDWGEVFRVSRFSPSNSDLSRRSRAFAATSPWTRRGEDTVPSKSPTASPVDAPGP